MPELCTELAALLKQPNAEDIKTEAKDDAKAHGWKRWKQGYKLDELIREICLIRRVFVDNWLHPFCAANAAFDIDALNRARRLVDSFFDNVIIEATCQFVEEHDVAVREREDEEARRRDSSTRTRTEFIHLISHRMREPLGPLLFTLEVLLREESLSPSGVEMVRILKSGIQEHARGIKELLSLIEGWPAENLHQK